MPPIVSIVVIGRNEGARLTRCLTSVEAALAAVSHEVLYVDSASTDGSPEAASALGAHVIALLPVRPTAALGRNAGWRAARATTILFLDGDTVLAEGFVEDALAALADPSVAVVWGHRREIDTTASVYNRVLDLDWIYPPGDTLFCGGDALFRRSALEETGGFDETLIAGEEPELCRRITGLGLRILHIDRAMTGHDLAMTHFPQYWKRAYRAGYAYAEVSKRFRNTPQPFWSAEVRRNRTRAVTLLAAALLTVMAMFMAGSFWPLTFAIACFAILVLRTAWKARWKSGDHITLVLYGIHSHLQQVPIFFGQLQQIIHSRAGHRAQLVEYKRESQ